MLARLPPPPPPRRDARATSDMAGVDEAEIRRRKTELRRQMTAKLEALPDEEIERQSAIVTEKVLNMEVYRRGELLAVYLSFGKELRTDAIVEHALRAGKRVYVPRFQPGKSEMQMVRLRDLEDLRSLPVNRWGIRQPALDDKRDTVFDEVALPLLLVPALAFTRQGAFVERGGALFDSFIWRCHDDTLMSQAVGLALNEQVLDAVPRTKLDEKLDRVICERY